MPEQVTSDLHGFQLVVFALVRGASSRRSTEEFLFRGVLFRSIRDRYGFWPGAIIVRRCCSGSIHYVPAPWPDALALQITMVVTGLGLAWVYEWRKTLLPPVVGHAAFNLIAVVVIVSDALQLTAVPPLPTSVCWARQAREGACSSSRVTSGSARWPARSTTRRPTARPPPTGRATSPSWSRPIPSAGCPTTSGATSTCGTAPAASGRLIEPAEGDAAAFVISATYRRWKDVVRGDLDPVRAMMQGKLRVRGDLPTILRYVQAAHELVVLCGVGADHGSPTRRDARGRVRGARAGSRSPRCPPAIERADRRPRAGDPRGDLRLRPALPARQDPHGPGGGARPRGRRGGGGRRAPRWRRCRPGERVVRLVRGGVRRLLVLRARADEPLRARGGVRRRARSAAIWPAPRPRWCGCRGPT